MRQDYICTCSCRKSLSFVENIDLTNLSEEEAGQLILDKAQAARQNYINSGDEKKRTIIVVNELDAIAREDSSVVEQLVDFMQNCAEEYKCTLFLTSNHPLDIDPRILNPKITPKKVALPPADYQTAKGIVQQRLSTYNRKIDDIDKFINVLFSNPDALYSNANIVNIVDIIEECIESPTLEDYIDVANDNVFPSVTKKGLQKFEKEKALLLG